MWWALLYPLLIINTMGIIGIGYAIGFIIYFFRYAAETFEATERNIVITFVMIIAIGLVYALFWPIVWLMEWNNQENKEWEDKREDERNKIRAHLLHFHRHWKGERYISVLHLLTMYVVQNARKMREFIDVSLVIVSFRTR